MVANNKGALNHSMTVLSNCVFGPGVNTSVPLVREQFSHEGHTQPHLTFGIARHTRQSLNGAPLALPERHASGKKQKRTCHDSPQSLDRRVLNRAGVESPPLITLRR